MAKYDTSNFDPPAPVASVTLRDRKSRKTVRDVSLLIDSGADVTLLPRTRIDELGVTPQADQRYELMGFDGSRSFSSVVILDMIFLKRVFRGSYLLIDEEFGVLGRDVLNHIAVLMDGPRQQWEIQ